MYEDKTYDVIMSEMLADQDNGVDTSEGSLTYSACGKCAAALEEAYSAMSSIYDNMEVDTQDEDHLIAEGAAQGCPIIEATPAVFKAQFNIAVDLATVFEAPDTDWTFYVTTLLDDTNHIYLVESEDPGIEVNSYLGEIEPSDSIEGFESGAITELYTAGTAQEDTEVYRRRRTDYYGVKPYAGNNAYYLQEIGALTGVGGVKVKRRAKGEETFPIYIVSSTYGVPDASVITYVQSAIDGGGTAGDGAGIAPTGAKPVATAVEGLTINISAKLTFDTGYTYDGLKSLIEAAIDAYYTEIGEAWQDATTVQIVRRSQIEIRLAAITGIVDVEDIMLNSASSNIDLGTYQIPVRGTFTCN